MPSSRGCASSSRFPAGTRQSYDSFNAVNNEVRRLRKAGRSADALDVLTHEEPRFPRQRGITRMLRVEILAELGRVDEAIALFRDTLAQGFRYRSRWFRDARFDPLRHHPEFSALIERADRAYDDAQAAAAATLDVIMPGGKAPAQGWPLLVALHGNNSDLAETAPWWRPAADVGWVVALPQSSEIALTPGVFLWNDADRALRDLDRHLAQLRRDLPIDDSRVVIAGFSMGGRLALELALSGRVPAAAALAVAPWLPDPDRLVAVIRDDVAARLRTTVIVGQDDDSGYAGSVRLVDHLRGGGHVSEIVTHDGGHEYPAAFGPMLNAILRSVSPAEG
jgi:predicted esterase